MARKLIEEITGHFPVGTVWFEQIHGGNQPMNKTRRWVDDPEQELDEVPYIPMPKHIEHLQHSDHDHPDKTQPQIALADAPMYMFPRHARLSPARRQILLRALSHMPQSSPARQRNGHMARQLRLEMPMPVMQLSPLQNEIEWAKYPHGYKRYPPSLSSAPVRPAKTSMAFAGGRGFRLSGPAPK